MQEINSHEIIRLGPRMARNISDEIAFLQSAAQKMIDDESTPPDVCDKIKMIKHAAGNVAQRARQFLMIAGVQDETAELIDVRNIIMDMTFLIKRVLGENHRLQTALEVGLWPIRGDLAKIHEILIPLVVNARDAMPEGGTLYVSGRNLSKAQCNAQLNNADFAADCVLVEVEDEGIGIPEEIMRCLFEPFVTTKGPGSGFGLAWVRHLVRSLNGQIICRSEAGRGTTFKIFLPRYTAALE